MNDERFGDERRGGQAQVIDGGDGALVRRPIDPQRLLAAVANAEAGGQVLFVGTVRAHGAGGVTTALDYEAHEPMAGPALERLCATAVERFGLSACALEHRLGRIAVGEVSVAVAASAPHRREAFAATVWVVSRFQREVPIGSCEVRSRGGRVW
ncbi:MAG: molybdopterin synthase catalytic subunit, partial [Planctomycetia bacterium]